jgi:hypothetical protein
MNRLSGSSQQYPHTEADNPPDEMDGYLRSDAESDMNARSETSASQSTILSVPIVRTTPHRSAARSKHPKAVSLEVEPIAVKRKTYAMSYDGMSQAEYVSYMISRGAR